MGLKVSGLLDIPSVQSDSAGFEEEFDDGTEEKNFTLKVFSRAPNV